MFRFKEIEVTKGSFYNMAYATGVQFSFCFSHITAE